MKRSILSLLFVAIVTQSGGIQAFQFPIGPHNHYHYTGSDSTQDRLTNTALSVGETALKLYLSYLFAKHLVKLEKESNIETPSQKQDTDNTKEKTEWFGPLPKEAEQIFNFVRNKELFAQAGISQGSNILLKGVPGTGKSHLARYIAQKLGVSFFEENGGGFHDTYIGVGPQKMKALFEQARNAAAQNNAAIGAVLFIDEIEGIGGKRENNPFGAADENIRLLNTLLAEMTNPENSRVLVICATNCPEMLDAALTRTGRFGLHVTMEPPLFENRKELFRNFLESKFKKGFILKHTITLDDGSQVIDRDPNTAVSPYSEELFEHAAQMSDGFVVSDIKEAVIRALTTAVETRQATTITKQELMDAIKTIQRQKGNNHPAIKPNNQLQFPLDELMRKLQPQAT